MVIAMFAGIATIFADFSFGWEASALVVLGVIVNLTRKTDSESDFRI